MAKSSEGKRLSVTFDGNCGYNDNYNMENTMLKKKLQLKSEALNVLSQELDQCRVQRDQFKLMAEQIQERLSQLKKQSHDNRDTSRPTGVDNDFRTMDLLMEMREQNKCLRLQVETLRQKLSDAQADIKVLRASNHSNAENIVPFAPDVHQREEMLEELEKLNIKCTQLQTDLQTILDEKHELETERDAFKCKAHRLNHELSKALSATTAVDLDSLINENRFLQERLQQLVEEKELARQSLSKYKGMLDSKRTKGTIKLGGNSAAGTVMTYKQGTRTIAPVQVTLTLSWTLLQIVQFYVNCDQNQCDSIKYRGMTATKFSMRRDKTKKSKKNCPSTYQHPSIVEQLLQQATQIPPQKSAAAISDLRRLCAALLEALNDKTLALVHQKKANKILASRISELDSAVQSPTMKLLEGYTGADVDLILDGDSNDPEDENKSTASDGLEKREDGLGVIEKSVEFPPSRSKHTLYGLSLDLPDLPKNLGDLVEKALLNLKENDKNK